jgi:hypothetical protein
MPAKNSCESKRFIDLPRFIGTDRHWPIATVCPILSIRYQIPKLPPRAEDRLAD